MHVCMRVCIQGVVEGMHATLIPYSGIWIRGGFRVRFVVP